MEVGCRMEPRTKRQQCVWRSRDYELGKMGVFVSYCYCTSCHTLIASSNTNLSYSLEVRCVKSGLKSVLEGLCSFWEP